MNKKLRRIFMVEQDVIPFHAPPREVITRAWPPGMSQTVQQTLSRSRRIADAQREVWGLPEVFPAHLFPEGRVEVYGRGGKPVMIASHIIDPDDQKVSLGREWAQKMGLDFAMLPVGESWHDENVVDAATVAVFLFKRA